MAPGDFYKKTYGKSSKPGDLYKKTYTSKPNLNEVQGLVKTAQKAGLEKEAQAIQEKKTPSRFQQFMDLLSRTNYAVANIAKETTDTKPSTLIDVLRAGERGIRGIDKTRFGDVLEQRERQTGMSEEQIQKGKIPRAAAGFTLDVALDPSTYLLAPVVKGVAKGVGFIGKQVGKIPIVNKAGTSIKEAAGRAFQFGYGTTEGLSDDLVSTIRRLAKSKKGIAESAIKRLKLSPSEEAKAFKALTETRIAELGARQAGKPAPTIQKAYENLLGRDGNFASKAVKRAKELGASDDTIKTMTAQLERNIKFAKTAGVAQPYESYFPFIKAKNLKQIEEATSKLKVGSEGYLKQFQAKLKPEEIINSLPEAYARREYQIVRDKIIRDTLGNITKKYGKQFATEKEAIGAGFVPLREKGVFGKVVGYLSKNDKQLVENILTPEFTTIDRLAKASGFDAFNRIWKTAVTKYFPAFHVRNWASGVTQNYEVIGKDALNPAIHLGARDLLRKMAGKSGKATMELGGKTYKTAKLAKEFENTFGRGDWQHIADLSDEIAKGTSNLKLKDFVSKTAGKLDYGAKAGEWVEQQQKAVAFLGSLNQGKSIKSALEIAEKAGFDYTKITPFEAKIMRRLIPFYTFSRKNIELQAKTLLNAPQRIANIGKTISGAERAIGGSKPSEEERSGLPEFVQQGVNIRTGQYDKYGRPLYITTGGMALEEALQNVSGNIPMRILSKTNPLLKYGFEKITDIDTFRSSGGDQVKSSEVRNADRYAQAPEWFKKFLKMTPVKRATYVKGKKVGERDGWNADPNRLRILNSLPTSRFTSTLSGLYDPARTIGEKISNFLTGVRTYPVDTEQQTYFKEKRQKEELTRLLEQAGIIKTFKAPYKVK